MLGRTTTGPAGCDCRLTVDKVIAQACRYGGEASGQLTQALAKANGVPPESIMLAAGSGEILRAVTLAFTGPGKALVQASPTFEAPGRMAPHPTLLTTGARPDYPPQRRS